MIVDVRVTRGTKVAFVDIVFHLPHRRVRRAHGARNAIAVCRHDKYVSIVDGRFKILLDQVTIRSWFTW